MIASSTAIIATATRLAEPRSAHARLECRHCFRRDGEPRQQLRPCGDPRDHQRAVAPQLQRRALRSDALSGIRRGTVVAAGRQPSGLPGGVDTAHLHRHRGEPGHAQHQHDDQRGDGERRLDGDRTGISS